MKKVKFPINKKEWSPSLVPGGIVLVSTIDENNTPHFAPKSWFQMVSFEPPIIMFAGSKGNVTENNILKTQDFVVNIVDEEIAGRAFESIQWQGEERLRQTGFSFGESSKAKSPLVNECKAHLECRLIETKEMGSGFLIFGEILAASIWSEIEAEKNKLKKYELLKQAVFQESGVFSVLNTIKTVT